MEEKFPFLVWLVLAFACVVFMLWPSRMSWRELSLASLKTLSPVIIAGGLFLALIFTDMPVFWAMVVLVCSAFAYPAVEPDVSARRFVQAVCLFGFGILVPVVTFLLTALMTPSWKGACHFGWIDCFNTGKLVFAPLLLWAAGAFYRVQVCSPPRSTSSPVVALGLFLGAIINGVWLAHGLLLQTESVSHAGEWLIIAAYSFLWYCVLSLKYFMATVKGCKAYLLTLLSTFPIWILSKEVSMSTYANLPGTPPSCFIVTAASRGHRSIVRPNVLICRHGQIRYVNRQLLTFWSLEHLWKSRFTRSHQIFRQVYDRLGPKMAAMIRSRLMADMVYLALKPVEFIATGLVYAANQKDISGKSLCKKERNHE